MIIFKTLHQFLTDFIPSRQLLETWKSAKLDFKSHCNEFILFWLQLFYFQVVMNWYQGQIFKNLLSNASDLSNQSAK